MKVVVRTLNDMHILHMEPDETVLSLKEYLVDYEEVPVERQSLYYAGKELLDQDTLGDYNLLAYNMQAEIELTMEVKMVTPMHIYVRTRLGKMVTLIVESTDSIKSVMERMEDPEWRKAGLDGTKLFNSHPVVVMKLTVGNRVPVEIDTDATMSRLVFLIAEADGSVAPHKIIFTAASDGNIHVHTGPSTNPSPGVGSYPHPRFPFSSSIVEKPPAGGESWESFKTELCTQSGPFPY